MTDPTAAERMRLVPFVLLVAVGCEKLEEIPPRSVLATTATTYVASDDPDPRFDYSLTVIARLRNDSDDIVRVSLAPTCSSYQLQLQSQQIALAPSPNNSAGCHFPG